MKTKTLLVTIMLINCVCVYAQEEIDVSKGEDRWEVKTNLLNKSKAKTVKLEKLLSLPLLDAKFSDKNFPDKLIPVKVGGSLHEGDIITTEGYLHLVALERASDTKRDGDYHIQLTLNPEWSDSCFIVEIPYSELAASGIKDECDKARKFIRKRLLKNENKNPSPSGNVMKDTVYVQVTGQLFYDAVHASTMRNPDPKKRVYRGKKGGQKTAMHSYTAWELHPVTSIKFAPIPK